MPKLTKVQIQEVKLRPNAEDIVPGLPSECAGSYQELGYYRHGVRRSESLIPYWDKINYFNLSGIDLDFHNKIEDYKRIFKADDALTRLKMRLASKSFNAKLVITDKIAPETDDLKSIFAIINEIPGNLDFHGLPCYEEALRAFCKFELGSFFSYLSDLIGLDSFLTFKQACRDYTSCEKQNEISQRFIALKESYSSFVDDVRACENGKMSIGFGETDDAKVNFEDIYGELKNTESDFNWIIKTLKSMPENQDCESDWKDERGCYFNVNIDPRHNPFAYTTKSLRLYDYGNGRSAPDEIEELINHLADQWSEMLSLLNEKFNFLGIQVEAAQAAFDTFIDFIDDTETYDPNDASCRFIKKTNIQAITSAMTTIAKALEKSHAEKVTQTNGVSMQATINWIYQSWDSFVGIGQAGLNDIYDNPGSTTAAPVRYQFLQPILQNGIINPAIQYFNVDDVANILNSMHALGEESPDEFLKIHEAVFEKYTGNWRHLLFNALPFYFPGEPVVAELQTTFTTLHHLTGDFGMFKVNTIDDKWKSSYENVFTKFCNLLQQLSLLQFKHDETSIKEAVKRKEILENPLTQKYFAWGAKTIDDLPIDALKVRKNELPKKPFEQNLKVKANTADELISTLNKNVSDYFSDLKKHLHNTMDDCYRNGFISNIDPIKVLHDDLLETANELAGKKLPKHKDQWAPLLAEILSLPSTTVHYYFWQDPDEGPTEPGLQYELRDGTKEEVFYDSRLVDWYDKIRELEDTIDAFINEALRRSQETKSQKLIDEWIDIKAKWELIFDEQDHRHSTGDLIGFANAFHEGVVKFCTAFPTLEIKEESPNTCTKTTADEKRAPSTTKFKRKRGRKSGRTGEPYDQFLAAKKLYEDPKSTFYHNANGAATNVLGWFGTAKDGHYQHALKGYSSCGTYEGVKSLARRVSRECNKTGTKRTPGRKPKPRK